MNAIGGQTLTYGQLVDQAARDYWNNRPRYTPKCGSVQGYYSHATAGTRPCPECRNARRQVVAITRLRARRAA